MGNVPNELVAAAARDAHWVVHRHLVKGVRGVHFLPAARFFLLKNWQKRAAVQLTAWRLLHASKFKDRGCDIDPAYDRLANNTALFGGRVAHDTRQSQSRFISHRFGTRERNAVVRD